MKLVNAHPDTLETAGQWVKQGACKDDPDAMFPGSLPAEIEDAKAVCRRCPVVQQCRKWALDTREPFGVWGGMSEKERANLLRQRGRGTGRKHATKAAA
jgi:WhiB family redox-sensing transcriptional regulator